MRTPIFQTNGELVKYLINLGVLRTKRIIDAFLEIDRKDFVGDENIGIAYADTALPIGYGQTISQPYTVAFMLELLEAKPGQRVLDIGAGSGWRTALLSRIVGANGFVYGKELIPELVQFANENLSKYGIENTSVRLAERDALGDPENAPFDRILISASAREFPQEILEQVKENGIIVMPIGNSIYKISKNRGKTLFQEYPGFTFVPLVY